MKKYFAIAFALLGFSSQAQVSTSAASQTISLELGNTIQISFNTTGTATGTLVRIPFNNPAQYSGGVQSPDYQLTIRSNKRFNLSVNTNDPYFSYTGAIIPAPKMPVNGTLSIMPVSNTTGGAVPAPFSSSKYASISERTQTLISGADNGGNQGISVKYKADPGFAYPGGIYTVDAIFTATQM